MDKDALEQAEEILDEALALEAWINRTVDEALALDEEMPPEAADMGEGRWRLLRALDGLDDLDEDTTYVLDMRDMTDEQRAEAYRFLEGAVEIWTDEYPEQ